MGKSVSYIVFILLILILVGCEKESKVDAKTSASKKATKTEVSTEKEVDSTTIVN